MNSKVGASFGVGMIVVGSIVMVVSAFLPVNELTGSLRPVGGNTLMRHGGWVLVFSAVAIVSSGIYAGRKPRRWPAPIGLCVLAAARVLLWVIDDSTRTVYPVRPDGSIAADGTGVLAPLGIALYAAAIGIAIAAAGSLILRATAKFVPSRRCPKCGQPAVDSTFCRRCGHRFGDDEFEETAA